MMWTIVAALFIVESKLYFMVERDWLGVMYTVLGVLAMLMVYLNERKLKKRIEDLEKKNRYVVEVEVKDKNT